MKKMLIALTCLGIITAANAMAETKVGTLDVQTDNEVGGKITVKDGSQVSIGGAKIGGADIGEKLEMRSTNTVEGGVKATGGSVVNIGALDASNVKADSLIYHNNTTVEGKVTAKDGAVVNIGSLNASGAEADSIEFRNLKTTVGGDVKVTGQGSELMLGSMDISGGKFGTVKMVTQNDVQGKVTVKNGGQALIGSAKLSGMEIDTVDITTTNTIQGNVKVDGAGSYLNVGSVTQ